MTIDLRPDLADDARLGLALSTTLFLGAEHGAVDESDAVLAIPDLPEEVVAAAQLARLVGLMAEDRKEAARHMANRILAGGDQAGADAALAGAVTAFAIIGWDDGRVADALDFAGAAVHRADRGPAEARQIHPRLALAPMLIATGNLDAAARCLAEASAEIAEVGDVLWATAPTMFDASLALASGRLDDAMAAAQHGIDTAERTGARLLLALGRSTCAMVALLTGDIDEAERQLRRAIADGCPKLGYGSALLVWIEARIAEARHGLAGAVAVGEKVLANADDHRRMLVEEPASGPWFTWAALASDMAREAAALVACLERLAADNRGVPTVEAAALHARSILDGDVDGLDRAALAHRTGWARGTALEHAGEVLAERGDAGGSRDRYERAATAYTETGATRDAARVRAKARSRRSRRAVRPVSGWPSLTDGERRVAELVAEGLTNVAAADRLYLSRHTVDFHLRHVFRKLGIRSRVELARMVAVGS